MFDPQTTVSDLEEHSGATERTTNALFTFHYELLEGDDWSNAEKNENPPLCLIDLSNSTDHMYHLSCTE